MSMRKIFLVSLAAIITATCHAQVKSASINNTIPITPQDTKETIIKKKQPVNLQLDWGLFVHLILKQRLQTL